MKFSNEVSDSMTLAIFPIPGSVQVPGTTAQFHIFEPRYRQMIHDCLKANRFCAISHVQRQIASAQNPTQGPDEFLKTNQETFEPKSIYGAGPVELRETLPDGRLLISIAIRGRYHTRKIIQELPYFVAEIDPYEDVFETLSETSRDSLVGAIHLELAKIFQERFALIRDRITQIHAYTDLARLTFAIFQFVKTDPNFLQELIECQRPSARAEMIISLLSRPMAGPAH